MTAIVGLLLLLSAVPPGAIARMWIARGPSPRRSAGRGEDRTLDLDVLLNSVAGAYEIGQRVRLFVRVDHLRDRPRA
jgi:hypothetical protein